MLALSPQPLPVELGEPAAPPALDTEAEKESWPAVTVMAYDTRTGESGITPLVQEACDILHVRCENGYGGLRLVVFSEPKGGTLGTAYFWPTLPCARIAWATAEPGVVAHELGHLLGLDHVPIEGNLMYPSRSGGGLKLEPIQYFIIETEAEWLSQCSGE